MRSTSTVPDVRAALVELIQGAVDLPSSDVTYGANQRMPQQRIVVGDTSIQEGERDWSLLGSTTRARDERYALGIAIVVLTPGLTQQAATERAYELWGQIEQAHIETPQLNVPGVIVTALDQPVDSDILNDNQGYGCELVSALLVQARITRSS